MKQKFTDATFDRSGIDARLWICGVASTATAISRWITAYRVLARRAVAPLES